MADFLLYPHSFLKIYLFAYYLCVCVCAKDTAMPVSICGSCICSGAQGSQTKAWIPGAMVTSSCESPCESWELHLGPLQEQEVH